MASKCTTTAICICEKIIRKGRGRVATPEGYDDSNKPMDAAFFHNDLLLFFKDMVWTSEILIAVKPQERSTDANNVRDSAQAQLRRELEFIGFVLPSSCRLRLQYCMEE